ncbi:AGE family epimerase/isomerase [Sandarakinorhabdus sp.]|uniref:AGE family epimerase/isomerase n=1 Tax=Sandarakinorhabdus sp. TaxID=1916663 RepID=UPI00286D839E|nr:AGE family epimerase/isomerase [Sandarakinorhabdus sp.]
MSESTAHADLISEAARARRWLCDVAAPLWASRGRTASGLFAERMTLDGVPDPAYFRVFVQSRHIYSFAAIGRMGWDGPWQPLISETIRALIAGARRADGFYVHRLDIDARPLDIRADLYDQAFVLLALATAGKALAEPRWFDVAEDLLDTIEANWSHPAGGFTEGEKDDPRIRRQNPHMHLFEATLALAEASGRPRFHAFAAMIADLAATRFIDPATGALLEYFTDDLAPAPGIEGRIVEPGHCFEWAWLFERLGASGRADAFGVSDRLTAFARSHGICARRNVCINEVLTDGSLHNDKARLWPQTERIKAAAIRHRRLGSTAEAEEAARALAGLEQYYAVPTPGLWRDKLNPDGSWIPELAPASSLYHIACAYAELAGG